MNPNIAKKRHAKSAQHQSHDDGHRHSGGAEHDQVNVGEMERQLSMIGGTVLAAYGLLRGSLSGIALATIGGALIWRGHTGHCEVYHMLGHTSADQVSGRAGGSRSGESHGEQAQSRNFEGQSSH